MIARKSCNWALRSLSTKTVVNEITVSSNGLVYMGAGTYSSGCCSGWSLPSSQGPSIHLAHSDLHTGTNGDVRYHTIGTEPNRTFVLSFENVALIGAATLVDGQLLLHEADGRIELYHGGIPPGNYHTFTLGINAGDGVRASYEPAFHLTSSTSSAHFEWEPTLDNFLSGPNGWPYSWTGNAPGNYLHTKAISGLSGTGAWSVKLEHEFDASAALPVDLSVTFHGLNKPMTALATYIGTDGLDEADTLKVQASDLQGNTAQLAMPIQILKVNDGDATFSPESSLLTYEEDATFTFSLEVEDLDGLSTDLGLWSDTSLVAPTFYAAGGTCSDFSASSNNGVLTVSCNCTAPANLSEGYHPEFTGPFGFEVHITDDQGFENTGSYLVEFSPVPDPTSFELLAPFDGGTLLSDTNAVSALTGSTPALMLAGTEDQDLTFELFIVDHDGQSLPPFGNTTPQPVTASCSQATVDIMELGLSGAIMTNGSQPGKFLLLTVDPFENVNGSIQVLVTSTDRFGVEVTLPLHIDLAPVNDPVSLSLVHNGAEDSPLSAVLSGVTPAAFGMWNTSLTVDEDAPLSFTVSAFDEADGIVTSALSAPVGPHTVSTIPGGLDASFELNADLGVEQQYVPAQDFPSHAQVMAGLDRDSIRFTMTDGDGHAVQIRLNLTVVPVNDGDAIITGEQAVSWYEDAVIRRTVLVEDLDGLTTKNVSVSNGAHGTAVLVDTTLVDWQTLSLTYDYSPNADYHGADEISLMIVDDQNFESPHYAIGLNIASLNDPMVMSSTLSDKCTVNPNAEDNDCTEDADNDGVCDEDDDCIDVNCDGLCDIDIAAGLWAVPEDDTLKVDVTFQAVPALEAASHTVALSDCGAPEVPAGWSLLAETDSALYLISDDIYPSWFAARQATEQTVGGKLMTIANEAELALIPGSESGWFGDYHLRTDEEWTNVSGTPSWNSEACAAGEDCFGWIDAGVPQSAGTNTNLIDGKQAIMELPFGICPAHGRLQAGAEAGSWRYVPDWNYFGTDHFSLAFVDAEGYTEFRHFSTEILNTDDEPMLGGNTILVNEEDHYSRGKVYMLDFDGLPEAAFMEASEVESMERINEAVFRDTTGTITAPDFDNIVWTSKGKLGHLTNLDSEEDPGGDRGFFYTDGLTFWAPLDGFLTDTVSNAEVTSNPPGASDWSSNRFGEAGKALRTEGAPLTLAIPGDQLGSPDAPRSLSLSLWFTLESALNTDGVLLSNVTDGMAVEGQLEVSASGTELMLNAAGESHTIKAYNHSWNHLVLTFEAFDSTLVAYINGEMAVNAFRTTPLQLPNTTLTIAGRPDNSYLWSGVIDDIAIWDRALTFGEAASLHKQEAAQFEHTPDVDQENASLISMISNGDSDAVAGRFSAEMQKRDRNYINITHSSVLDYGCADENALNFDFKALADTTGNAGHVAAMNAMYCEYPDISGRSWTPNDDPDRLTETIRVSGDSDADGVLDTEEISGCDDPTACNYNPEATDSYANYSFLEYLHLGATDSTRFYISRTPVSWEQALEDAAAVGGHIGTVQSVEEALMLADRTSFSNEIALAPADTLHLTGHKFILMGEAEGSRYYRSETDTLSLHDWMNTPEVRWSQLRENLLVIESEAENAALTNMLFEAQIPYAWLALTDDDMLGVGEGNWTHLRDSSGLGYENWAIPPVDTDPNFLRNQDIQDQQYDYAQLWSIGTVPDQGYLGTHSTGVNHDIAAGQWGFTFRDGIQAFYDSEGEVTFEARNAPLILELQGGWCTPTFNFAVADSNGHALASNACPNRDTPRVTLLEIPRNTTTDCRFPEEECEHCLTERDNFDKLPITYVGRTDSSKYYISTSAVSMEDLLSGLDYDFGQLSEHMVRIGGQQENDEIVALFETSGLSGVEHLWLGVTDSTAEGDWRNLRDNTPAPYFNWDQDENFDGRNDDFIQGHRYGRYDYAQMWLKGGDRRWHDASGTEIIPDNQPEPGAWVAVPSYGVIQSGAFPAYVLFEFPHAEFEVLGGYDNNENEVCDHAENFECLDVFSDVSIAPADGEIAMMFNGHDTFDQDRIYLMGWGTYTLFDVPAETPITLIAEHPEYITVTGDSSTAIVGNVPSGINGSSAAPAHFFSGDVEITVSGEFGSASFYSATEGLLRTHRKVQSHRPSTENVCAGICLSDNNFNNICDEYEGCMEPTACNYKPTATYDDGSCVDAWNCTGCQDESACNYSINATKAGNAETVYVTGYDAGYLPYTPPGLGSVPYPIPAFCVFLDPQDACEYCSGDVDGTGLVLGGDTLINGAVWCLEEIGCADPSACDFNDAADPTNPLAASGCTLYPASGTCEYCSGAQDGSGFIISGDEDGDEVCDVIDANRRIPLTMMAYTGTATDGRIEVDGPYADLSWDFTVPGQHKRELVVYENFTSIQFGQAFDLAVTDAGHFASQFSTPTAENMPPGIVAENKPVYAPRPVFVLESKEGIALVADPLGTEETQWLGKAGQDTRTVEINIDNVDMLGQFQRFDGTDFVNVDFDKDNLTESSDHTDRFLAIATYSTSNAFAGSDLSLRDRSNEQTYFGDSLISWLPTHYQEFKDDAFGSDLAALGLSATLARTESASAHLEGAAFKSSGIRTYPGIPGISESTTQEVDYYHFDAARKTWSNTLDNLPYASLQAKLAQPTSPIAVSSFSGSPAWLHGRLGAVSGNGAIGGTNAKLFWHWGNSPNQETNMVAQTLEGTNEDWSGRVANPILGANLNGPGFMSFPLISGYQSADWDSNTLQFKEYTDTEKRNFGHGLRDVQKPHVLVELVFQIPQSCLRSEFIRRTLLH